LLLVEDYVVFAAGREAHLGDVSLVELLVDLAGNLFQLPDRGFRHAAPLCSCF